MSLIIQALNIELDSLTVLCRQNTVYIGFCILDNKGILVGWSIAKMHLVLIPLSVSELILRVAGTSARRKIFPEFFSEIFKVLYHC